MTEINFYVSAQTGLEARLAICHRLIQKAREHDFRVHIHTPDKNSSEQLSNTLWRKSGTDFETNTILEASDTSPDGEKRLEVITISHEHSPMQHCDYLINLSDQQLNFFSRFNKVAEVIDNQEDILSAGRERYAFYRDRGYTLNYHQL